MSCPNSEAEPFPNRQSLLDFILTQGHGIKGLSQLPLKTLPSHFIQPHHQTLAGTAISPAGSSIPIIDVSDWTNHDVTSAIVDAASTGGFFQIINHGIPHEILEGVKEATHEFFDLPVEERRKYRAGKSPSDSVWLDSSFSPTREGVLEWKDHLSHLCDGREHEDSNLWPLVSRDRVMEYVKHMKPVIRKLLEILLSGLNVKHIGKEKESMLMGSFLTNLNCYPKCVNPDLVVGVAPHSDIASITVLLQDDVGGLYVRGVDDRWIHVPPINDALVINIGDALQIMSNGKYKSVEHQVFVGGNKERVSVPIFVAPSKDALIGPLPETMEAGEKPIYKNLIFSDYKKYFFSKGHDGKQTIDFAKI